MEGAGQIGAPALVTVGICSCKPPVTAGEEVPWVFGMCLAEAVCHFLIHLSFTLFSSNAVSFSQHDVHPSLILDRGVEVHRSSENIFCSFLCWSRLVSWWGWGGRARLSGKVKKKATGRCMVPAGRKCLLTALPCSSFSQDVSKNRKDLQLASGQLSFEQFCISQHPSIALSTQNGRSHTETPHEHTLFVWLVYHRTV